MFPTTKTLNMMSDLQSCLAQVRSAEKKVDFWIESPEYGKSQCFPVSEFGDVLNELLRSDERFSFYIRMNSQIGTDPRSAELGFDDDVNSDFSIEQILNYATKKLMGNIARQAWASGYTDSDKDFHEITREFRI